MRFGIWSNGFRRHTSAAEAYDEDLFEICLADELGFSDAYISEHHGEPIYIDRVDVLPVPELLMCKAASLTSRIRLGASVKVIHLQSPIDVAAQAAVTDHLLGGRYVFGYGSGFPGPWFAESRGLTAEDRHARTTEALELIIACWTNAEPFDFEGRFYTAEQLVVQPKPLQTPHPPIATATFTPQSMELAGRRGYTLLTVGPAGAIRWAADVYAAAAAAAGHEAPLDKVTASAFVYIADSVAEGIEDIREAVEYEMEFQRARGLLRMMLDGTGIDPERATLDELVAAGFYVVGDPDDVYEQLLEHYHDAGGYGTLLLGVGKDWATRAKREESMRRFAAEVAPRLGPLVPDRVVELPGV